MGRLKFQLPALVQLLGHRLEWGLQLRNTFSMSLHAFHRNSLRHRQRMPTPESLRLREPGPTTRAIFGCINRSVIRLES